MQQDSFQYNCNSNDPVILLLVSVARLNDDDASQITTQLDFFFFRKWMFIEIYLCFTDKIHYSRNTWIFTLLAYYFFSIQKSCIRDN